MTISVCDKNTENDTENIGGFTFSESNLFDHPMSLFSNDGILLFVCVFFIFFFFTHTHTHTHPCDTCKQMYKAYHNLSCFDDCLNMQHDGSNAAAAAAADSSTPADDGTNIDVGAV